jgi:hypothetical protein
VNAEGSNVSRTNVLKGRELEGRVSAPCRAPAAVVYELLVDLTSHLEWGGTRRTGKSRLLSVDAPPGPASVGTEFSSTGQDSMCRMNDRSIVTTASPSRAFEFVTESICEFKNGTRADWTIVHRYDIEPDLDGSRIRYTHRATRASALPGPLALFRVPVLRSIAVAMSLLDLRRGFRNLVLMAEEHASPNQGKVDGRAEEAGKDVSRRIGRRTSS